MRAELNKDPTGGWRALATLTRGQVDTFLFVNFPTRNCSISPVMQGWSSTPPSRRGQRTPGPSWSSFKRSTAAPISTFGTLPERSRNGTRLCALRPVLRLGNTKKALDHPSLLAIQMSAGAVTSAMKAK